MEPRDKIVKHLEMIQAIVNRLGGNSFLLKGWSMTLIVASLVVISRGSLENPLIILALIIPVVVFWILDGYFLWQERLFRQVYNEVRLKDNTDFEMNVAKHKNRPNCSWASSIFSLSLNIFYMGEVLSIVSIFFIIKCSHL